MYPNISQKFLSLTHSSLLFSQIEKHHSKAGVMPISVSPVYPDFEVSLPDTTEVVIR